MGGLGSPKCEGSRELPPWPKAWVLGRVTTRPPAAIARFMAASASATKTRRCTGSVHLIVVECDQDSVAKKTCLCVRRCQQRPDLHVAGRGFGGGDGT
jgi:hypothetical protein